MLDLNHYCYDLIHISNGSILSQVAAVAAATEEDVVMTSEASLVSATAADPVDSHPSVNGFD